MRSFPIKKLYNPQYDLLSISDKEEMLYQIGEIYNLELISFKNFAAFRQSTYTAVYRSQDVYKRQLQELEDLYLPYRPKKRTRAMIARERGLEPLAEMILNDTVTSGDPLEIAKEFVTEEVPTLEDAIQGASDIVAEIVSDSADSVSYTHLDVYKRQDR